VEVCCARWFGLRVRDQGENDGPLLSMLEFQFGQSVRLD
jgi:hypothetical protein